MRAMRVFAPISRFLSLSAAVALTLGSTSEAALLVWESFDYPADSGNDWNNDGKFDLHGLNGGQGFAGAWREVIDGPSPDTEPYSVINPGNMVPPSSVGDLKSSGNSLISNLVDGDSRLWRELAPIDISTPRTLWMGFLASRVSGTSNSTGSGQWFYLSLSPTDVNGRDDNRIYLGDYQYHDFVLFGSPNSSEEIQRSNIVAETGEVAWLVMKMDFNPAGSDRFELFVNPTPGTTPTAPNAVMTSLDLPELRYLGVRAMSATATRRQWSLDEVRIGDTFQDISVPEPATGLMFLLGAAALGFRRQRS